MEKETAQAIGSMNGTARSEPSHWLPGVTAHSPLLWIEIPIRIATGRWNHKQMIIEVLD